MRVDRFDFDPFLSQNAVDNIINDMAVSLEMFSDIACLDGQAYGVSKACEDCGITMNWCLRRHMVRALVAAQSAAERAVGYNLTPRYHQQVISWDGRSRIRTTWPGVEVVSVQLEYTDLAGGPYAISPYIESEINISEDDGICIATADGTLVKNPNKVLVRNENHRLYPQFAAPGYPKKEDGNWLIALDEMLTPCNCELDFSVQHCEYMILEIANPAGCAEGTVVPVYPDSNQVIPQALPSQDIGGGMTRYWFNPWVLLDAAFAEEGADLLRAEFYKLLQEIEFKCVSEVELPPSVVFQVPDCPATSWETSTEGITLHIVDSRLGIIHVEHEDLRCGMCHAVLNTCGCKYPLSLSIGYKTNPELVGVSAEISTLKEAIAYLAAAELPMENCDCKIDKGFIAKAQTPYTEIRINPMTGENIANLKHGNLYGQLVYDERVYKAPKITVPVKI
jgi:hypothetical protein